MTYDRETNQIVTQDSRAWIAGLGDEGGAGSWLAAMMKEFGQPNKAELDKISAVRRRRALGRPAVQRRTAAIRRAEEPLLLSTRSNARQATIAATSIGAAGPAGTRRHSESVDRSYNYPHVAALYWVMYRLARNHEGLVTNHPWDWYLTHAYQTVGGHDQVAADYARFGQMEGDIFLQILDDLKREGMTTRGRGPRSEDESPRRSLARQAYPFGSEMPWDSTGQEEVYAWTKYFGDTDKAEVTLNAILGYDADVAALGIQRQRPPLLGFHYAGKITRMERQLHHYGSGINAIPVLAEYREHPEDLYLLRVGYGGTMGAITNIDQEGFASAAFHSFPDTLKFDPYLRRLRPELLRSCLQHGHLYRE